MATSTIQLGDAKDVVAVEFAGHAIRVVESYDIDVSFFTQPAAFSVKMGDDGDAKGFAEAFPPRTPFRLIVNGRTVASGRTDGYDLSYSAGGTEVTIYGRDWLQDIHDAFVRHDKTFKNATFAQLVEGALKEVGLGDATLIYTNDTNRDAIVGKASNVLAPPRSVSLETIESVGGGKVFKTPQSKLGERWFEFLMRHLERVGLFLWAAAEVDENGNPTFVLSEPNAQQAPIARLTQSETNAYNLSRVGHEVSILSAQYHNDTKGRFSEAVVHSRGGGKKFGRTKGKGDFSDPEMLALGYDRPIVMKDVDCQNAKQAEFMARRRIAEGRRSGVSLSYTVSGHTFAALGGGRGVWAPDTVVAVDDDRLGLKGNFWIESVHFSRSTTETITRLALQRPEDLLFGDVMPPDLATVTAQIEQIKAAAKIPKSSAS